MVLPALQRRLTYFPSAGPVPSATWVLDGGRDVTLQTADGLELGAWHVPARAGRVTVLVTNGNGGDLAFHGAAPTGIYDDPVPGNCDVSASGSGAPGFAQPE